MSRQTAPATPLPWKVAVAGTTNIIHGGNPHLRIASNNTTPTYNPENVDADAAYIAHAANAYPKLVEAIEALLDSRNIKDCPGGLWSTADADNYQRAERARAILRELGERS